MPQVSPATRNHPAQMSMVPKLRSLSLSDSEAGFVALHSIQNLDGRGNTDETVKVWLREKEDGGKLLAGGGDFQPFVMER